MSHVCDGTIKSAYTSLTRSYAIAEWYAYTGLTPPSPASPGHVYEVVIDEPAPPGVTAVDPLFAVMDANRDALVPRSYHHDGGRDFLLGIVDPANMGHHLLTPAKNPPHSGRTTRTPYLSKDLETLVRALRDAEVLVVGNLPASCFVNRHDVY